MKNLLILVLLSGATLLEAEENKEKPVLYTKQSCMWCKKVFMKVKNLENRVEIRDVVEENNRKELILIGGKGQIPCLIVNGVPIYESNAIIEYLNDSELDN
ncbi:MAG: glutathione S-transferase N-terminal domain-containing protein [Chlamydiia bacterium]